MSLPFNLYQALVRIGRVKYCAKFWTKQLLSLLSWIIEFNRRPALNTITDINDHLTVSVLDIVLEPIREADASSYLYLVNKGSV